MMVSILLPPISLLKKRITNGVLVILSSTFTNVEFFINPFYTDEDDAAIAKMSDSSLFVKDALSKQSGSKKVFYVKEKDATPMIKKKLLSISVSVS
ncbi:hypothetical protein H8356DRAFT_1332539 [Neocallimastix lanati (nom. inval.)]|nr:hypothetical protein H8356DRAFT_1332539 [Neocallimastix sp. JGI-2020a]